jgi:hypothetical protein
VLYGSNVDYYTLDSATMDRKEFHSAVVSYEAALNRQGNWALVGLFAAILPPCVTFILPIEWRPPFLALIAVWVAVLIAYGFIVGRVSRNTAVTYGMVCSKCQVLLDLRHVGFTNACKGCGTQVFAESNHPMQPTAVGGG